MSEVHEEAAGSRLTLADFVHLRRERILQVWEGRVREMQRADQLATAQLRNHLPHVLEHVSQELGRKGPHSEVLEESPEMHALHRLEEGYDQHHLVIEYSVLRDVVLELYAHYSGGQVEIEELLHLNAVIDEAILVALKRHAEARQRALIGLDRISQAALVSDDTDVFLPALLRVLMESNPAIDTVSVLLVEDGNLLRVQAAVGLEQEATKNLTIPVGSGFSGMIAQRKQPMELHGAEIGQRVMSPYLRGKGLRVLYGVPLMEGAHLLGVAIMGSLTTREFSDDDKLLFRTMCERVAALLHRHRLRESAKAEQERAMAFRDRFLGIVSHDLRNPLNAIILSANRLLMEEGLSEAALRASRRIMNSANRMSRMISDLLDFTRGRLGGGIPVSPQPMNLKHVARHVVEELSIAFPDRRVVLEGEGDFHGCWDPDRLAQLLGNLLKNALDYSPEASEVRVKLSAEPSQVRIEVHNDGPPIPPDILPTLFDAFRRGVEGSGQGLGLGLYIVKEIARAHSGDVEVRSDAEQGTVFTVTLPRTAPA